LGFNRAIPAHLFLSLEEKNLEVAVDKEKFLQKYIAVLITVLYIIIAMRLMIIPPESLLLLCWIVPKMERKLSGIIIVTQCNRVIH
jgi:hypothetical protein